MRQLTHAPWFTRSLKLAAAFAAAAALSGCIVAPYGPGYYHPWHPYRWGYY